MRKQLFFIGMLVVAILFAGCSKEKEEEVKKEEKKELSQEEALIGRWHSESVSCTFDGLSRPTYYIRGQERFTFHADKTVEWYYNNHIYTYEGTYAIDGSSLTITITNLSTEGPVIYGGETFPIDLANGETIAAPIRERTYSISGNRLTLTRAGDFPVEEEIKTFEIRTLFLKAK
jgi:hypothetical protein